MNETLRTLVYVSVAVVVGLISWATQPTPPKRAVVTGTAVLSDLTDVAEAASFEITRYDEELAKLENFKVAKQRDRWVIPSHHDYPADAADQLKKVAGLFVDLKSIVEVTRNPKEFEMYGVVEPTKEIEAGAKGVGRLITIADKKGDALVQLIIGKKAESIGSKEGGSAADETHYVRIAGQDAVHVAHISLDSITTKFDEWIERDLLKLNAFDVKKMALNDYSIVLGRQGNYVLPQKVRRMETQVTLNQQNNWHLDEMKVFEGGNPTATELAEDEELNKNKLEGVKTALDNLQIIDVDPKPGILLKAMQDDKLARNAEAQQELFQYGFVVLPNDQNKLEIWGFNGGVRVTMKDGVEYSLVFGKPKGAEKGDATKLNRYLMVTAKVDPTMIPKPELEVEQPEPAGPAAGDKKADDTKAEESKDEEKKPDAKKADAEKTEEEIKAEETAKKERERIKRDNQRKMDDYHEQIKKAENRAAELNSRFGDWFYVVSDEVYKKVQLSRSDLVKDSELAKEGGFGIDAFRSLEHGGPKLTTPKAPPAPPRLPGSEN